MKKYILIDETGDPQFFAKRKRPLWPAPGFVPIICLGMVTTDDRRRLRNAVMDFQTQVLSDPLFNSIGIATVYPQRGAALFCSAGKAL